MSSTEGNIVGGDDVVPPCGVWTGVSCGLSSGVVEVGPDPGRRRVRAGYFPTLISGLGGSVSPWS